MNHRLSLTCIILLLLVSLAAAPVLAAALSSSVTCPSTCSCLLPEEAKKAGSPGYCQGQQKICGSDTGTIKRYCYEKPVTVTTTTVLPQLVATGFHPVPTTAPVFVKCSYDCSCLFEPLGEHLTLCGGKQSLCGMDINGVPMYCYVTPTRSPSDATTFITRTYGVLPVTSVPSSSATPAVSPSGTPVPVRSVKAVPEPVRSAASCSAGCACLLPADAEKRGLSYCGGKQTTCTGSSGLTPAGAPAEKRYCYTIPAGSPVPTSMLIPAVISITQTPVSPAVRTVSKRDIAIAKLFGSTPSQSSTPSQRVLCNGSLVNTWTDPANCGACGAFCAEGLVCTMGQCLQNVGSAAVQSPCSAFQIQCNGTCSYYLHDDVNCGRCGNQCGVFESCCGGHCTNTNSDSANCHDCGNRCGENAVCSDGLCTCINSTIRCGTVCADPLTNEEHCGGCNIRCGAGEECCDGHCIGVTRNANNCGTCNHNCGVGIYCIDGRCVNPETNEEHCGDANTPCGPGQFCCNGVCINPLTNPGHCGSCNTQCYGIPCIDGECINFLNDEDNCGSLGNYCWGGNGGDTCCNGRCVDLDIDDDNCGQCGHSCWGVTPYCMYDDCGGIGDLLFSAIFGIY